METQIKRYNVVIHGRVQDMGFRDLISSMANFLRLKGYVFNDSDGSVKVIVEGAADTLDSFLEDIRVKTTHIGAEIEGLDKREVSFDFDLPPRFVKISTTELEEFGRKFDVGIGKLTSMDGKLDKLETMDGKLDKLEAIDGKLDKLGTIDGKLDKLEAIDGKLDKLGTMDRKLDKLEAIDGKLDKLDVLVEGQDRMGDTQDKMLKVLEKIEDKL